MLVCPHCGANFVAHVDVCFNCGTAVKPRAQEKVCPACAKRYPGDYFDQFCTCGTELTVSPPPQALAPPSQPSATGPARRLVFIGSDRKPISSFALTKDATLIGRLDAVQASFPDIDVDACADAASARKVSRRHALILHRRADDTFWLRPLGGNTGTQIESEMVPAMVDHPLTPGTRIILGGAVRFRFEVM
jgi:pSer/pThr/pTyr-binding forkhead associated (FHA) protein